MMDYFSIGPWPFLGMLFGLFWMVVFWGGIIALIIWGVGRLTRPSQDSSATPLEIAKIRYAKGEISKEEFERLKKDLV